MPPELQVCYHGNCFDGVVSAALFTRFYKPRLPQGSQVVYRGMAHGPADPFGPDHEATFNAAVNVVVDFRYSPSPSLNWWCDHHHTTWLQPEDQAHFEADTGGQKRFDSGAPSCAGLLSRWLARRHGFDAEPVAELVRWADIIDSAAFESPRQAVELKDPAMQLAMLLESAPPAALTDQLIVTLAETGQLEAALQLPEVQAAMGPMLARHEQDIERFRTRMVVEQGVAQVDLTADGVDGFNKFIPYYLADGVRYTVVLTDSARRAKVSVGSNPWQRPDPLHNIGELCKRFGGGGHPVVGAVTLPAGDLKGARAAYAEILQKLRT